MNARMRERFDRQLESVLAEMPNLVHKLLEKIPLHVEDYPSAHVLEEMGVERRDGLCGLYTGVPLNKQSVSEAIHLPEVVAIYREGIWSSAADAWGRVTVKRLRREIRKTILHELAHHHGLTEKELEQLGYG
ncbi:MAG: metallopeptidase family protein [Thermoguttaceae bacterium]